MEPHTVTEELVRMLLRLTPLAPDHLPHEIRAIRAVKRSYPALPQVACFDTAFHRHMPRLARMYPLPRFLEREGVRRYGFHGLSCEYIMAELEKEAGKEAAGRRIIIAHLGNGASMTAVRNGKSMDTTMGFTPAGGLMMGTRPGDLDPGVMLYLLGRKGAAAFDGQRHGEPACGSPGRLCKDVRHEELLSAETTDPHAAEAVMLFCYQAGKFVGALAAVLGGLDTLVFTGGIGENAPAVRAAICSGLEFLGIEIDPAANRANMPIISAGGSRVSVRVMKTDEEWMTARHTFNLLQREAGRGKSVVTLPYLSESTGGTGPKTRSR